MNEKVKQALENFKCIKEDLDYFQPKDLVCTNREEQYKSIETALNDFDKYYESQQDLIKGKDEYIAKLCNDRAELKEHEKELIAEQHRLFDLAKEQEEALKVIAEKNVIILWVKLSNSVEQYNALRSVEEYHLTPKEFGLLKKVMEKYGK